VVAEVVVGHRDGAVAVDGDVRRKGLLVARRDGRRRLVDLDRVRPVQAAVGGHGKGDVVVGETAEAAVRPDGVEVAVVRVGGDGEDRLAGPHRGAGVRVADVHRPDGGAGDDVGPGGALVLGGDDAQHVPARLGRLVARAGEAREDVHQRAVRLDDDLVAEPRLVGLAVGQVPVRRGRVGGRAAVPGEAAVGGAGEEDVFAEGEPVEGVDVLAVAGMVEAVPDDVDGLAGGVGRVGSDRLLVVGQVDGVRAGRRLVVDELCRGAPGGAPGGGLAYPCRGVAGG